MSWVHLSVFPTAFQHCHCCQAQAEICIIYGIKHPKAHDDSYPKDRPFGSQLVLVRRTIGSIVSRRNAARRMMRTESSFYMIHEPAVQCLGAVMMLQTGTETIQREFSNFDIDYVDINNKQYLEKALTGAFSFIFIALH